MDEEPNPWIFLLIGGFLGWAIVSLIIFTVRVLAAIF